MTTKIYEIRKAEKESAGSNREDYWRKQAEEAQRKLRAKSGEATAVEILVEKAVELAPVTYAPPSFSPPVRKTSKGSPQSAVLLLSDTHIGKVVTKDQTLGMSEYNFEIFLRRLAQLERSVFSIIQDHTTTKVPEIVVPILGDMLDGALPHGVEAGLENTIFTQFYAAGHALAQFLRNLSSIAPLRVYTAVGNHTRFQNQHRMPASNIFSNFDQFLFAYLQSLLRDVPTIQFNLDKQPFALFDVQGHGFYCGHGFHLRGGDKALGIPSHSVGRMLSTTSQTFGMLDKPMPRYFCFGHLHRSITLPHARGEVIIGGGFPGLDGYALMEGFNPARPSQKFFFVHKTFGKSASYDIQLDHGDSIPHTYQIPNGFACR